MLKLYELTEQRNLTAPYACGSYPYPYPYPKKPIRYVLGHTKVHTNKLTNINVFFSINNF